MTPGSVGAQLERGRANGPLHRTARAGHQRSAAPRQRGPVTGLARAQVLTARVAALEAEAAAASAASRAAPGAEEPGAQDVAAIRAAAEADAAALRAAREQLRELQVRPCRRGSRS